MLDRKYFTVRPALFYRELLLPGVVLVASYAVCLQAQSWSLFLIAYVVAVIALHRAGILLHDICHQYGNPKLRQLILMWDLTIGAVVALPAARFLKSHHIHHTVGTFRTKADPQYLLLRSDRKLAVIVLVVIPLLLPLINLITAIGASLFGMRLEEAIERAANRHGMTIGNVIEPKHQSRVIWISRLTVVLYALYIALLPETVGIAYAVLAGAWYLVTLRVPLEHRLHSLKERTTRRDQVLDSFTIETPLAALFQPLAMRFHTAHHLYPAVPYHNLPALHQHLKATSADYRASIVPFWAAVRGAFPPEPAPVKG